MRILLIGSGGREHAMAWKLAQSPRLSKLFVAPGNGGMSQTAQCVALNVGDHAAIIAFCRDEAIDLVVVGPEAPLVAGLVDDLSQAGIAAFGPTKAAAALEGSKSFTKSLCDSYQIPTARYAAFSALAEARAYVEGQGAPIVIKANGLAAGKGVTVAETLSEAIAALEALADASGQIDVVIEDCLRGPEASYFALVDGLTVLPLGTAQDHKRAFEGDQGPNTGGMGAYSPAHVLTPALEAEVLETIIRPTARGMVERGTPFRGILFAGLMLTDEGPKLIEYNVRFGDPECQVLMMRLNSDLLELISGTVSGHLAEMTASWSEQAAVTVVIASKGYPGSYEKDVPIPGLLDLKSPDHSMLFHAGTRSDGDDIFAIGGRVLNATAMDETVKGANASAYALVQAVNWSGGFYRSDIAASAITAAND